MVRLVLGCWLAAIAISAIEADGNLTMQGSLRPTRADIQWEAEHSTAVHATVVPGDRQ